MQTRQYFGQARRSGTFQRAYAQPAAGLHTLYAQLGFVHQGAYFAGIDIERMASGRGQQTLFFTQKKLHAQLFLHLHDACGNARRYAVQGLGGLADTARVHHSQKGTQV